MGVKMSAVLVYKKPGLTKDILASLVVFLVALPLCLGIALASGAPIISGLLSGIVGGIIVGALSGSHTSVSGPAAGLTAVVLAQALMLGSFEAFLASVIVCGAVQIIFGLMRAGFIASFFPTSVISGLLSAIGLILILKQIPHLIGFDQDYEGEMSFFQHDHNNTFSEIFLSFSHVHLGAAIIGLSCLGLLIFWGKNKTLKNSLCPPQLVLVIAAVLANLVFASFIPAFEIEAEHRVSLPLLSGFSDIKQLFIWPDLSTFKNPLVFVAGFSLAIVASLETLLNLEAVDKMDPKKRRSPPNRELVAQGIGNLILGFIGGLPVTSVIVRSSVNINAQAESKKSAIMHGFLLLICALFFPYILNLIPLSSLAAILIITGYKLANPNIFMAYLKKGYDQFIPYLATVFGILFTDLLIGICIGLSISIVFILKNHYQKPLHISKEKAFKDKILRINLAEQVSFLNRVSIKKTLDTLPEQAMVIIDATNTNFIDNDVIEIIKDFKANKCAEKNIRLSLVGFNKRWNIEDCISFVEHADNELQKMLSPDEILEAMKEGNQRFLEGKRLPRNLNRQKIATASGQYPLAVSLSCIDSRTPVELLFDLGIGDIFSIRLAGNTVSERVLGSLEFACSIAGAKLILVMGHTKCGAVNASIDLLRKNKTAKELYGCDHLDHLISDIQSSLQFIKANGGNENLDANKDELEVLAVKSNLRHSMELIKAKSPVLARLIARKEVLLMGGIYDVASGEVEFIEDQNQILEGTQVKQSLQSKVDSIIEAPRAS